jgi:pimeloyl-ACP methyl ester carboxylesterase
MTRAHRARVAGYVLALGAYERPFETLLHGKFGPLPKAMIAASPAAVVGATMKLGKFAMRAPIVHRLAQRTSMVGEQTPHAAMKPFYDHMADIDAPTWLGLARSAAEHSAADLLPTVQVPTLVVTGGRDTLTPPTIGRAMAAGIPGAEYLEIPTATHTGLLDASTAIIGATHRFLHRAGFLGA